MTEKQTLGYRSIFSGENFDHIEGPFTVTYNGMTKLFLRYVVSNPEIVEMLSEGRWDIEIKLSPHQEVSDEND